MRAGYLRGESEQAAVARAVAALEAAGCSQVVVESGPRGVAGANPAFAALVSRLQPGDVVVVVDLDHIAAGLQQLLDRLMDLASRGIEVQALSGEIDTVSPAVGGIIRALHAFGIRARSGRAVRRIGPPQSLGRPRRLLADDIMRARRLIEAGGRPISDVARELGVSRATLYRNLRSK